MLPVKDHCTLLTKQFLAASFQNCHPAHQNLEKNRSARNLKPTCLNYKDEVGEKFRGGTYKDVLKKLHTEAFSKTLQRYKPNRVLQANPPEINPEEAELSRSVRSKLCRLRSGFCRSLNSYMSRIDKDISDVCPKCNMTPHDTLHLFNCPRNQTELSPTKLWTEPQKVAKFLKLDDDG